MDSPEKSHLWGLKRRFIFRGKARGRKIRKERDQTAEHERLSRLGLVWESLPYNAESIEGGLRVETEILDAAGV